MFWISRIYPSEKQIYQAFFMGAMVDFASRHEELLSESSSFLLYKIEVQLPLP